MASQNDDDVPVTPLDWLGKIIKTSEKMDSLATGALLATAGGAFVLGIVLGGIFWIPFGMSLPLIPYRLYKEHIERKQREVENRQLREAKHRVHLIEAVKEMTESIYGSNLPEKQKEILLEKANQILEEMIPDKRSLPPVSDDRD
jgi:hypothetical protein